MNASRSAPALLLLLLVGCGTQPSPTIDVLEGSVGANCGAPRGTVTHDLAATCTGRTACDYRVPEPISGDPVSSCAHEYVAVWRCGREVTLRRAAVAVATGGATTVSLTCQ